MADGPGTIPRIKNRSATIDFIENRLPGLHPAFSGAQNVFDDETDRFVPLVPLPSALNFTMSDNQNQNLVLQTSADQNPLGEQHHETDQAQSMKFWTEIFPEAKDQLLRTSPEPRGLSKSGGIRDATNWDEIVNRLSSAKHAYTHAEGKVGILRKGMRKAAENMAQPAAHTAKLVPDIHPWVTPVVGTVGLLMQAMSTAAKTRQEILKSIENLDETFLNINRFAATFPRDSYVRQASVALVVAIFVAVEKAIAFFEQSAGK